MRQKCIIKHLLTSKQQSLTMLFYLSLSDLPSGENHMGNIALRKSGKSTNYHVATELQREKTDIRMKPDWLNDNLSVSVVTVAEDSYLRHTMAPYLSFLVDTAGICHGETAVSGEKGVSRIRQSVVPIVVTRAKRRLPKSECHKAMNLGSENPTRQRSVHSSPSRLTPCTWRRDTVGNSVKLMDNVRDV